MKHPFSPLSQLLASLILLSACQAPLSVATSDLPAPYLKTDLEAVQNVLNQHGDLNKPVFQGSPPLIVATYLGQIDLVKTLLDRGAEVDQQGVHNETALMQAALTQHLEILELLLQRGASVDSSDEQGQTAVFYLAKGLWCSDQETDCSPGQKVKTAQTILARLLKAGARVNQPDRIGNTPLMAATHYQTEDTDWLQALVTAGAKLDLQNHEGQTALMVAASEGNTKTEQFLLDQGADAHLKDAKGHTYQAFKDDFALTQMVQEQSAEALNEAIANGAQLNFESSLLPPLLFYAIPAKTEALKKVNLLLAQHPNLEARDSATGDTPLMSAVESGSKEVVMALLEAGAQVNSQNNYGETALHQAYFYGHPELADILLQHGADPDIADVSGIAPSNH